MTMYYNSDDQTHFLESELSGLRMARNSAKNCADLIRKKWNREEVALDRSDAPDNAEYRITPAYAARERFRTAYKEAVKLKDEVASLEYDLGYEESEYGDMDEYGYVV